MHLKTTFISGKYRPKWPQMAQKLKKKSIFLDKSRFVGHPKPLKSLKNTQMTYLYLKHVYMSRKYILKQLSPEGSTAQNGHKRLKIAKIHYFTIGAHTAKSRFPGPSMPLNSIKNTQNDLFIRQTCINVPEMHPKTTFISGKYRPKWPQMAQKLKKKSMFLDKSRFVGYPKPLKSLKNTQNDLFIPQTCINVPEMHPKTTFISGKYRPKWPEMAKKLKKSLFFLISPDL